uniref:Uncharacterized protein n=1 Tax=Heterorhabditis bacteriophora TaxID=37862 RepID=A0A1I7WLY2_HETBA
MPELRFQSNAVPTPKTLYDATVLPSSKISMYKSCISSMLRRS